MGTLDNQKLYNKYVVNGGTLSFEEWMGARKPEGPEFGAGDQEILDYNAYKRNGGTLSFSDWKTDGSPTSGVGDKDFLEGPDPETEPIALDNRTDFERWMDAKHPGLRDTLSSFQLQPYRDKYAASLEGLGDGGGGDGGGGGGAVYQDADGNWVHDLNDTIWSTEADAMANYNSTLQSQGFQQDLATSVEEYEAEIERLGQEQTAEASRLSARNIGKMSTEGRNALLSRGYTNAEIDQLMAGGLEGSQRSLNDLLQQMSLSTQQQLAGASQFGIGTQLTAESLGQAQQKISTSQSQFGQSLAESVRQFNQAQGQQASQFTAGLGFSQQQLAQQQGQFEESQPGFWDYAGQWAAPIGTVAAAKIYVGCFDGDVKVITEKGNVPISMLKPHDLIKTKNGFQPIKAVHEYDQSATVVVNGIKGRPHPFVMAGGELRMSHHLRIGDMLWGGIRVDDVGPVDGQGTVHNLDVPSHTFYLEGKILVHTGRDQNAAT